MRRIIFNEESIEIDSGFFFGKGVFETILVKSKAIFLSDHIERLNKSIKFLKLGEKISEDKILSLMEEFNIKNCILKIIVTERNLVLNTREINYKAEDYLKGFSLKISKSIRNSRSKLTYIKSINYLENLLEREEAIKNGYDEVIFLNESGYLSEGSMSNIFIIKNNEILTPNITQGLLPGITRDFIVKRYNVIEKEITLEELFNADEIFITNSVLGIMKINKIENKILGENKLTNIIREDYNKMIES